MVVADPDPLAVRSPAPSGLVSRILMPMIAAIVWVDQQLLEQLTRGTLPEVWISSFSGSL